MVGVICAAILAGILSPLAYLLFIPWLALLSVLPVIPVVGVIWGRHAEQRALLTRLEEALDFALKRLRRADDTETAYFAIKDALEGHPAVAGAALFVKDTKTNRAGFTPAITAGALLGLRTFTKVTDFEHLMFMTRGEELLYRSEIKRLVDQGQGASSDKPLLALLEEAGIDVIWMLTGDDGPVAAIVMREAVGVSLGTDQLRDCLAKRGVALGRALWPVLPQAFEPDEKTPSNPKIPTPIPPRPLSTKTGPVAIAKDEPPEAPKTPEPAPSVEEDEPEDLRAPFSLVPDPVGLIVASPLLEEVASQVAELLPRQKVVRLVGPRGGAKHLIAFALALEQNGTIDWHAASIEEDPEDPDADLLVWDEDRSGPFVEKPRKALCIILSTQGEGISVPLLAEVGAVLVASCLAEQLAEKKIELTQDAKDWLASTTFPADIEELLLLIARALLLHGDNAALTACMLGQREAVEAPVSVIEETEPMQEDLRDAALKEALSASEGQEFHEAVTLFKKALVKKALESTRNNRAKAARLLGLQRTYLYRLIRQLGLEDDPQKAFDEPLSPR